MNNHSNNNNLKQTTMATAVAGRSSSHISIYDYPEHLNPFYEDENHKRIRFWKIGTKNPKIRRSNSFSLNNIKEMWAFKSFKLKKRSSTLGINKTSESPPLLRRQIHPAYGDSYNHNEQVDNSRLRHTFDVGLADGDHFQRNAIYRSSLQDVTRDKVSDIGMIRNNRYRSTIQNGFNTIAAPQSNRYGSVTPTPTSRYLTGRLGHGLSQNSLSSSTNPFDDDEDDTISQAESIDSTSPIRRSRKKRRAPQPPVHNSFRPGETSTPSKVEIHPDVIKENSLEDVEANEITEISNLTSEIESFVKTADTDSEQLQINSTKSKLTPGLENQTKSISQIVDETERPLSIHEELKPIECAEQIILIRKIAEESRDSPENNEDYPERMSQSPDKDSLYKIIKSFSEKQLNTTADPPKIIVRLASNESDTSSNVEVEGAVTIELKDENKESSVIVETDKDPVNNNQNEEYKITMSTQKNDESVIEFREKIKSNNLVNEEELKIIEPNDTVPVPMPRHGNDRYSIRFVALKNTSPELNRQASGDDITMKKTNNNNQTQNKSSSTGKRRSVKDIIASINKSQSLLRINRDKYKDKKNVDTINDPLPSTTNTLPMESSRNGTNRNTTETKINEKELHEMMCQLGKGDVNLSTTTTDIPVTVEHFDELNNNNQGIFKKCEYRNEDGLPVINSQNSCISRTANLDWNPVPKPRRAKQQYTTNGTTPNTNNNNHIDIENSN